MSTSITRDALVFNHVTIEGQVVNLWPRKHLLFYNLPPHASGRTIFQNYKVDSVRTSKKYSEGAWPRLLFGLSWSLPQTKLNRLFNRKTGLVQKNRTFTKNPTHTGTDFKKTTVIWVFTISDKCLAICFY